MSYSETQRFSNLRWLWVLMVGLLLAEVLVVLPGLMDNPSLLIVTMAISLIPIVLILVVFRYELTIDHSGIKYRFIPRLIRWRVIPFADVQFYTLQEKRTLYEKIQIGYSKNLFLKNEIINITGNKYLVLELKSGARVKLGTENADTMAQVLKKLMSKSFEA
jgi:hypothetical protein